MMLVPEMKARLEEEYPLQVKEVTVEAPHLYRVRMEQGEGRLVRVGIKPSQLIVAYTVVDHLRERGFLQMLQIMLTRSGEPYFEYANRYWILMEWVAGRQPELTRLGDVERVTRELARMHRYMAGMYPPIGEKGAQGWDDWPETVIQGRNLLELYTHRVLRQSIRSEFDQILVQAREVLLERMNRAVELAHSLSCRQMMLTEREERSFALQQVKEKELLLGFDGRIYLVQPWNVQYDVRVKDLGRWLKRLMKEHLSYQDQIPQVMAWYEEERPLSRGEREWLLSYLLYPARVMKILERYILRKRRWTEEGYVQKLREALRGVEREMKAYIGVAEYFFGDGLTETSVVDQKQIEILGSGGLASSR